MELDWSKPNLVHVANTIRSYFGLSTYHEIDAELMMWLQQKQTKQIIVLLIDALGWHQLQTLSKEDSFLRRNVKRKIMTVYPPTTVAATTSFLSGKYPCETAWLGWQQCFKEIDEHLVMFLNRSYYTQEPYREQNYTFEKVAVNNIVTDCLMHGIQAKEIYPAFRKDGVSSFEELCQRIVEESKMQKNQCVYAYWDEFDACMHRHGVNAEASKAMLQSYDLLMEQYFTSLSSDTALLVLADHGQIDVTHRCIQEDPTLMTYLRHLPSIEPRTINFYIKPESKKAFVTYFQKVYGDKFLLMTQAEVLQNKLFGEGKEHPMLKAFLGDYIAIAVSNEELIYAKEKAVKGSHAGYTKEEMEIPLLCYCTKDL